MDARDRHADGDGAAGELVVPSAPRSVAVVRRYAVDACRALGWGDSADTVALLVTEVATNAVLHAYGPDIRVRVLDRGRRLRVEVFDGSTVQPSQRRSPPGSENGRGLGILDSLAVSWGFDTVLGGKTAWFEIEN
ncbi:MAG TPA: ATP-binding protein [Mycobacteriales bacterium]|nr:ATP-binding protein [Mycobacteriales bacterium]